MRRPRTTRPGCAMARIARREPGVGRPRALGDGILPDGRGRPRSRTRSRECAAVGARRRGRPGTRGGCDRRTARGRSRHRGADGDALARSVQGAGVHRRIGRVLRGGGVPAGTSGGDARCRTSWPTWPSSRRTGLGPLTVTQPGDAIRRRRTRRAGCRRRRGPARRPLRGAERAPRLIVERVAANDPNPTDPLRGLYITDEQALAAARTAPAPNEERWNRHHPPRPRPAGRNGPGAGRRRS